jgi:chromosome segregation protein
LYLKQVEMENFKSFGKKLTVPFFPGFTAITGPNGSGKSNIADAILFVLGPKSSKVMRAGRLTDLIFNGGKKQKNPSKYCRVSLVFDNRERRMPVEADEVVLTRMIKRAPLQHDPDNYYSYYYINDRSASFSDFVNVLSQARISGDGYNIVKQGDVTSVFEMGSVERRKLIDDIAGISTFDTDIKKAEEEKQEVDTNLERIHIVLNEINSQIRQLKHDRDAAFRYKELKEQLYGIKAKIAMKKKQEMYAQIAEVQRQIESYEKEQEKLSDQSKEFKEQYAQAQQELEEIEKKIGDIGGDEVKDIKEKIEQIRREEVIVEERMNYATDEIRELQKEIRALTENGSSIEKELAKHAAEKGELLNKLQACQTSLQEKETALSSMKVDIAKRDDTSMELSHDLLKMREEYDEKNTLIHELNLKRDRLEEKRDALDLQIAALEETRQTYEFELKDIDWQKEEATKGYQQKKKETRELEQQLFAKKKQETEITEQLTNLDRVIHRLQRRQSQLQAEYDALQSVQGMYHQAVHKILYARDEHLIEGIHGTVAELAKVEEQYKTAVEIAAGGRMQAIIVDDDRVAANAIRFLQKEKLGRATFLPLNKMVTGKPRGQALMAIKDPKAHGFAIDLVSFKENYRGAFWYVFGDTIVVDSLDDARRLMGGVRLVDLEGSLIEASGAMVGGSTPKKRLSFGRVDRQELEEVTRELQEAIRAQDGLLEQRAAIQQDITELEQHLGQLKSEADKDLQWKDLDVQRKDYHGKLEILLKDLEEKNTQKEALQGELTELEQHLKEYEARLEALNRLKEEKTRVLLKGTKKEQAQEARELEADVTQMQKEILQISSQLETVEKKCELLEERKSEISERLQEKQQGLEDFKQQIEETKQTREHFRNELQALMKVEEQMTGAIKQYTEKRDVIYRKTVSIENELDKMNTRIESYYDLISRAKYRLPTLEDAVSELVEELKLYQVDLPEDAQLPTVDSLKDSLRVTEETMQELEPVNMRALEEYEHQTERKNKLDEDVHRLKDQKKNLMNLVNEITTKKEERFNEVFHEINKNFQMIYAQLSEGGEAELLLESPDSLFEGGLTIKARPRGKKILRLSALSGGEKSIASLALIFAIQRYDPSPFYVLDEVDMFLDGVNAETVSRMIKRNALDSQFIMVSLRKVALKEANHVYGVTMRDTGVSEMIANVDPDTVGPQGELVTPAGGFSNG